MELLNRQQVLEISGVKGQTIDYWRKNGYVTAVKIKNQWYYHKDKFFAFLHSRNEKMKQKPDDTPGIFCHVTKKHTNYKTLGSFCRNQLKGKLGFSDSQVQDYYDKFVLACDEDKYCEFCGKEKTFINFAKGYREHCTNPKCRAKSQDIQESIRKSRREKYGEDWYDKEKINDTRLKKYGDSRYTNREKYKKTCLKRYGVDNSLKMKSVREKQRQTSLAKYGVPHFTNGKKISQSKSRNFLDSIQSFLKQEKLELKEFDCGVLKMRCSHGHVFEITTKLFYARRNENKTICTECNPIDLKHSDDEKRLVEFIKQYYSGPVNENEKDIINGELDIYLPELNLAFEYNGIYWHSSLFKGRKYHAKKTRQCLDKNIHLIHIFENDWVLKEDLIKSIILYKLNSLEEKISARKCSIREINDTDVCREFLQENHIQGYANSQVALGLYHNETLVSLMTFHKSRFNKNYEWELVRFCNKKYTVVNGAASRLLNWFEKSYDPESIISYADLSYSNGHLYEQLGFECINQTEPGYFYVDKITFERKHRSSMRKELLKEDSRKTEDELVLEQDTHYKIYNSGNLVFVKS